MPKKKNDDVFIKVFMNSPAMMVITEADSGIVLEVNKQFEEFYGYTRKEVIGKTLKQLKGFVDETDRDKIARYVKENSIGKNIEIQERTKNGEIRWVNVSVQMMNLFGKKCFVGSGTDVTDKKKNHRNNGASSIGQNASVIKKILIADDHPATRKGVQAILSSGFQEMEFGEAASSAEVMKQIKENKWDMLILDMNIPGRNGLEILRHIKEQELNIPVLLFSTQPESQAGPMAFKSGAKGYLCKDAADEELLKAAEQILSGRKYITPSLAEQFALQLENPDNKLPHELLSDREFQTFILIAKGKQPGQIAEEMSLSTSTVGAFRHRILEKMKMKNNSELIRYAMQNNLV